MALPKTLNQALQATASITVTELYNEGRSAANDPMEYPLAEISEVLDKRTCPLCQRVDGMILQVGSPEYAQWRQPSHINCRRILTYISKDEVDVKADFKSPDPELIRKHGHYHIDPEKHAALRVPAEPAGRHFVVRRVRDLETGELRTVLDWAPWHDQLTQEQKRLILGIRATTDEAALQRYLAELGITDLTDPEHLRRAALFGVRDRIEGWITETYKVREAAVPKWIRDLLGAAGSPNIIRVTAPAQSIKDAEQWARENISGLQQVDYSRIDIQAATAINEVVKEVTDTFGVIVRRVVPYKAAGISEARESYMAVVNGQIAYNPSFLGPGRAGIIDIAMRMESYRSAATKGLRPLAAHEMAHIIERSGRTSLGASLGVQRSENLVKNIVEEFRARQGEVKIRRELGGRAWEGDIDLPGEQWRETWAQAFSAYWSDRRTLSRSTRSMVERVLDALFPEQP